MDMLQSNQHILLAIFCVNKFFFNYSLKLFNECNEIFHLYLKATFFSINMRLKRLFAIDSVK